MEAAMIDLEEVAKIILAAEIKEGQCDETTSYSSYLPAARAAVNVCLDQAAALAERCEVTLSEDDPFGTQQVADAIRTLKIPEE
jgi:hypothetical protein